uniref:Uncharacterized protein n=1 Tax=Physcomitrium patens TaxID=3218 RepID=A0A2K1K373_PHYPA|nr:hypothetical protein PHYPA_012699 [Physcomitrium patens]
MGAFLLRILDCSSIHPLLYFVDRDRTVLCSAFDEENRNRERSIFQRICFGLLGTGSVRTKIRDPLDGNLTRSHQG